MTRRKRSKRTNPKKPGSCIFCGGPGLTHEHIFSEWMHPYFGVPGPGGNQTTLEVIEPVGDELRIKKIPLKHRQGSIFTKQLRVVCGQGNKDSNACNNTWMSVIETQAKPHMMRLIRGEQFDLYWPAQLAVAAWIAVKSAVAEYAVPGGVGISQQDRRIIWHLKKPPLGWRIWLGWYRGDAWAPAKYRHHSLEGRRADLPSTAVPLAFLEETATVAPNSHSSTFVIGALLIQVHTHFRAEDISGFRGLIANKLQQLWPPPRDNFFRVFHKKINWPPKAGGLIDDEVTFIADAFYNDSTGISQFSPKD